MRDPTVPQQPAMPGETQDQPSNAVLAVSLSHVQQQMGQISAAITSISTNLSVLTRLEESHSHVLEQLKNGSITMTQHEKRLQTLETKIGPLEELRKWVIGGLLAGVSMIGVALVKLVIVDPAQQAKTPQIIYVQPPTPPAKAASAAIIQLPT